MELIRVCTSDNFFVDYDKSRGMYRFTVNKPDYYVAEFWFDAYEEKELLKTGIVGTYVGTPIIINNECEGCIHYDGCGYFDFDNSDLTEEERFAEHCVGCCCGDGCECNKNNGCDNWEDGSEQLMG